MDEEIKTGEIIQTSAIKSRPVILTMLCLFSFVYLFLLTALFLAGLFNAGWITKVTNQYLASADFTKAQTTLIFGAGFLLHGLAFTGVLFIWNLRKKGYYLFTVVCLMIALLQTLLPDISVTTTAVYIIMIIIYGIFFTRYH
ncbi:MAG: hypothetical protein WCK09_07330 [Bacteroidota bacterium]